jgi:SAM-dependent methyltransferase
MTTVAEHYAAHLAPIYIWMAGGFENALARGEGEINAVCPGRVERFSAVDLGAGFGMHAIPLARRGYLVLAVDSSPALLEVLQSHAGTLPVRTVQDDLLAFPKYLDSKVNLIVCMGDTLPHLPDLQSVEHLFAHVANSLHPGGQFITSFRDYTIPLNEDKRFIPVRSDHGRILTCFLEYSSDHVTVHDLLHERRGAEWQFRVSAYTKLRLSPDWVRSALQAKGFTVRVESGISGMVRLVATSH